jgi:hypothetical protein
MARVQLVRVSCRFFVAGLEIDYEGFVVREAPILHFMHNWYWKRVYAYCARKGWVVRRVREL